MTRRDPRTRVSFARVLHTLTLTTILYSLGGCRADMQNQPKFVPLRGTTFFADGRAVRQQIPGTVARGQLHTDTYFVTGKVNGVEMDVLPFPITMTVLKRGQERFNIYCSPCHSRVGNGVGMIVMRGYKPAGNFVHDPNRVRQPLGHYFAVMTEGQNAMPAVGDQIAPADRWAIAAYMRALQLSQNAKPSDVEAGATPRNLKAIAQDQGLPESFADLWQMPETSITQRGKILSQEVDFATGETLATPKRAPATSR